MKTVRCGKSGHYSNDCYVKTNINEEKISESSEEEIEVFCCSYCDKEFDTLKGATCHENLYCKYKNKNYYAKNTIKNENSSNEEVFCCSYCDKEFDTLKGATCHENLYCKYKNNKSTKSNKNITSEKNACYRCGRDGHYSTDCYASKHVNGKYIFN